MMGLFGHPPYPCFADLGLKWTRVDCAFYNRWEGVKLRETFRLTVQIFTTKLYKIITRPQEIFLKYLPLNQLEI